VISYGEDKPVSPNNTKDGRAQNRRVVIKVLA
jgi:outer membrane protein OmpA-like peptidoglycan-associated protein